MKHKYGVLSKKSQEAEEHFQIRYLDLIRLIDVNDLRRFQQLAVKIDLNSLQSGNKPFLFYAIEKNDYALVKFLLDLEINLDTKYLVVMDSEDEQKQFEFNPVQYARFLKRNEINDLIERKMEGPSLEDRWYNVLQSLKIEDIEKFRLQIKNSSQYKEMIHLGLIKAAEMGSNKLIDYFIGNLSVDINCLCLVNDIKVTPLLQAISFKRNETVKYLIFRKADIHKKGEFGDALVTAIHYETSNDLITLVLEKGASLASRHNHWPHINLREYCVQMNKVQAKSAIDAFVFRLIANGEYEKLKTLAENGYININVTNRFRKTGRDLAIERCHSNIVQLIDKIEDKQRRLKTKMNY